MEIYLVGGAVRDQLLGLAVNDRDWVVVGARVEEMLEGGYQQVGRDFPVFLHPKTHEEYALARTERKSGVGYTGFDVDSSEKVTLEQDLMRRDLTINAIAQTPDGNLIDPFNGHQDLKNRVLRHVSDAFIEDPVRVLRVARFAARFARFGFSVHPTTLELMKHMVGNNEVDHLVAERVWTETDKALGEHQAEVFFTCLRNCGALARIFPELEALYGVPQPARWHPEIDTGVHTMMVLHQACLLSNSSEVRFAALMHDLGKGTTPKEILPSHHGHEERSVSLVNALSDRLRVPGRYRTLALLVAEYHGKVHRCFELKSTSLVKLVKAADGLRRPERFEDFLLACEADARGRTGFEDRPYPQADYLRGVLSTLQGIKINELVAELDDGEAIATAIYQRQVSQTKAFKRQWENP